MTIRGPKPRRIALGSFVVTSPSLTSGSSLCIELFLTFFFWDFYDFFMPSRGCVPNFSHQMLVWGILSRSKEPQFETILAHP